MKNGDTVDCGCTSHIPHHTLSLCLSHWGNEQRYTAGMQVRGRYGARSMEHGVWILPPSVRGCVKMPSPLLHFVAGLLQEILDHWSSGCSGMRGYLGTISMCLLGTLLVAASHRQGRNKPGSGSGAKYLCFSFPCSLLRNKLAQAQAQA